MVPKKGCQFTILGFKDGTPTGRCWSTVYMKWTFSSLGGSVDDDVFLPHKLGCLWDMGVYDHPRVDLWGLVIDLSLSSYRYL